MIKKMFFRAMVSAPLSILVSQIISLCVSMHLGGGRYFPVHPAFAAMFKNEIAPVIAQMLIVGLVGAVFAACSVIFEIERWSFLKQGAAHFAITFAVLLPACLVCWPPMTFEGAIITVASMSFTYGSAWLSRYLVWKSQIRKLNEKIRSANREVPYERH